MDRPLVVRLVGDWFRQHRRDLPWRRSTPWGVMVSEFMLQQTPVSRVLGPWQEWLERWPEPDDLAAEQPGAAVAAWGRLGYPRRAQRLHRAATVISEQHGGRVPESLADLQALPGVGRYTAAAIHSFAFGGRAVVLDTNIRRLLCRVEQGREFPPDQATAAEWRQAELWLPDEPAEAAQWAAASMELGALVCTARSPRCDECPVRELCAWRAAGYPRHDGPPRRAQAWHGTDRQCRGVLLDLVRHQPDGVRVEVALEAWADREQAERSLAGLLSDDLLRTADGLLRL
ncbi:MULTISPECIES: A/G-specific adenine glycosylase [unclassified Luteococcus]|uniref:A/G-specific adenine glycosylase n=1 Tax=unclassified Luteococcus TaxID=2639923 RepID=UPI00313D39A1